MSEFIKVPHSLTWILWDG